MEGLIGLIALASYHKMNLSVDLVNIESLKSAPFKTETKVNEIKEDVEVRIDDEFAKTLGMNDLEALKKAVSDQISKQHQQQSRDKAKRQILDKLADTVSFDLPETLEKVSIQPTTTLGILCFIIKSEHGGVLPKCEQGSRLT